jgi:hypothetical protein
MTILQQFCQKREISPPPKRSRNMLSDNNLHQHGIMLHASEHVRRVAKIRPTDARKTSDSAAGSSVQALVPTMAKRRIPTRVLLRSYSHPTRFLLVPYCRKPSKSGRKPRIPKVKDFSNCREQDVHQTTAWQAFLPRLPAPGYNSVSGRAAYALAFPPHRSGPRFHCSPETHE